MSNRGQIVLVICIFIVVMTVVGGCYYTVNTPADTTCEQIIKLDEDKYSLLNCEQRNQLHTKERYNLILTIDSPGR